MTIDLPDLDDKTFSDLFEEAEKRLPAYDDGWTDYNPSDPGIVLLELLAFLTDTYMYQLDSVADEHRRKYLQLMGETQRPPEAASLQLSLALPTGSKSARIPADTQLGVIDETDSQLVFETTDDVVLLDTSITAVVTDHGAGRTDHTFANRQPGMFYRGLGPNAAEGNAMYLGFNGDPFGNEDSLELTIDFHEGDLPPPASHGDEDPHFFPSVSVLWEYCTDYENARRNSAWRRLTVLRDRTYAFYRGGRISLARPDDWTPEDWGIPDFGIHGRDPGLIWIRCRVLNGGYEIPPQFDGVRLNVVTAEHRRTIEDETLRRTTQNGDLSTLNAQTYTFEHTPVLEAEISVDGEPWTEVDDLDNSGPTDNDYVLDPTAGTVRFGDGIDGRLPPLTATVVADRYVQGGGSEGNVAESSSIQFLDRDREVGDDVTLGDVAVTAASPGTGGRDAESLESAFRRTRRDMRTPHRAVTQDDYRYVATHTPGLRFGRATVLSEEADGTGTDDNPVRVVVVAVPYAPLSQPRPAPSEGFLDAVQRHVDQHRLITDRVSVVPPDYVDISMDVEVLTAGWIPEARIQDAIESSINEYIHAIHGFEGDGWPFGRTLYKSELRELLNGVDLIDQVGEVSVHAHGNARVDGDENVLIDGSTLFALADVRTDIRTGTTLGEGE